MEAEGLPHLAIKQEPKKKKSSQGSPVIKAMTGMLAVPPLPKPKQIIINPANDNIWKGFIGNISLVVSGSIEE